MMPLLITSIQDFSNNLAGTGIFSKVDLVRGYDQIPVHPADVQMTAIVIHLEFLRTPFIPSTPVLEALSKNKGFQDQHGRPHINHLC